MIQEKTVDRVFGRRDVESAGAAAAAVLRQDTWRPIHLDVRHGDVAQVPAFGSGEGIAATQAGRVVTLDGHSVVVARGGG